MTKVKLSFMHLLVVFMVANICNASRSRVTSSIKVHKHLNLLNKAPVKSIKSPDGDTIDCVHIAHQPAFDHPLLKNHTIIKVCMPSYHPDWIKDLNNKMNGSKVGSLTSPPRKHKSITQLWHSNGKCPKGTIPIRRTNKDDVKKKHSLHVAQPSFTDVRKGHEVAPPVFGDTNTRLFIYWTSDGYQHTGCYKHQCSGFIQTNYEIALGGSISPTSQDQTQGNWWMQLGEKVIGYWPASLFSYLSQSASTVQWGGEVINIALGGQHTTTQMGSGHFPQEGAGKASYIKDIQIVDESNNLRTPQGQHHYTRKELL
ncbi:hypothetical protein R6Q57_010031 [Mikania cordata]